jgi:hypothetical protein
MKKKRNMKKKKKIEGEEDGRSGEYKGNIINISNLFSKENIINI